MKKSSIVFGSILSGLGLLYAVCALGLLGDLFFVISFIALIGVAPVLTEHFNEGSTKEYIVKGVFSGCLLLTLFFDLGLVFNLIMAGVILLCGIIMALFDIIKNKVVVKDKRFKKRND